VCRSCGRRGSRASGLKAGVDRDGALALKGVLARHDPVKVGVKVFSSVGVGAVAREQAIDDDSGGSEPSRLIGVGDVISVGGGDAEQENSDR
jgi:hypothetical protein